MQFIQPFKNFDPINGELHKKTPPVINYYFKLAKDSLVNRNYEEIEFAISTINYLLDRGRELLINSELNKEKEKETSDIELDTSSINQFFNELIVEKKHFTPSAMLYDVYCHFNIEINNQEDFKNAKWAEYFAVLALAEIAEMQDSIVDSPHPTILISQSAEIGEAIAYARTFMELTNPDSKAARTILSLRASKGGIESNKAFNDVKREYIDWFDADYCPGRDDSEINFSEAARQFYEQKIQPLISKNYKHPLAAQKKKNALRMLESALREQRRSRGES